MKDDKVGDEGCSTTSSTSSSLSSSGVLRFKKIPNAEIMSSIQVAIQRTVASVEVEPERDLLIHDFMTFECLTFHTQDSVDFKFQNYAPIAFKYFRRLFQIKTINFLQSMCSEKLRQLTNSGSSGSTFFLTHDDEYILKTAQQREGEFLLKLLPGYYLNLTQNPRTLLPKFFGFYCYQGFNKNFRIVVMNNLVPSNISIDKKYDLKGSTTKRKATQDELKKAFPTYKDLDFVEHYPDGLLLDPEIHTEFTKTLQRDCRVLESFKIIDYSLLLAVHCVDPNVRRKSEHWNGIPAKTASGEDLLLFVGIIDILQSYQFRKKMEHTLKSLIYEKDSISVHRPDFYSQRFQNFIIKTVLRPMSKRMSTLHTSMQQIETFNSASFEERQRIPQSSLSLSWIPWGVKHSKKQPSVTLLTGGDRRVTLASEERTTKQKQSCERVGEEKEASKGDDKLKPEVVKPDEDCEKPVQSVSKPNLSAPLEFLSTAI